VIDAHRAFLLAQGGDGLLSWAAQVRAAETLGLSLGEVEEALDCLYRCGEGPGEQTRLGNPAFTPMAAAAFQVAEAR
jgi:hypothetical protein